MTTTDLQLDASRISAEIERIAAFLRNHVADAQSVVLGLSGGIDSDLTARIAVKALGVRRVKFFTVLQSGMEDRHLHNARTLAAELGVALAELPLGAWPGALIGALADADPGEGFRKDGFLDVGRAKNSLRTVIYSTYHDRGYVTLGTSNRTEVECGFFVRLGDGIWHLGPIAHLYKTQVYQLAQAMGCRDEVIRQPASAGYWQGESDLEDLSYWMVNAAPIGAQRDFSAAEIALANAIHSELSFERLDLGLATIAGGAFSPAAIAQASGLTVPTAERLIHLVAAAKRIKGSILGVQLAPLLNQSS